MENEIIVGLDIGTTKIACFVGVKTEDDKVKILGYGKTASAGVTRGSVLNIFDTRDAIRVAVKDASDQANVDIEEVWVGIAGQHIKSRPSDGQIILSDDHQLICQEDVDLLISEQYRQMLPPGEEIIHIFPQNFIVDGDTLPRDMSPVGVRGKTISAKFHMVTGDKNAVRNIQDAVEKAGLKVKGLVLEPVASAMAVLNESDLEAGVALVDIGGGTTDIAVFYDGIIRHTSVLPTAGEAITESVRQGCNLLRDQAESLKVKFGSCLPSAVSENDVISIPSMRSQVPREIYMKNLAGIINVHTKLILEQVGYEIQLSGYDQKLIGGVVLTGGGSRLNNITDLCELVTATDSRIGTPDEHLAAGTVASDELAHPMYATGIGLLLYGIEHSEASPEAEEKEQATTTSKTDIFADLPPAAEPQPQPEPSAAAAPSKPSKGRRNFGSAIQKWLEGFLGEDLDKD